MYKRIIAFSLFVICLIFTTSCGNNKKTYNPEDYILNLEYVDNFKILQLTDLHLSDKDDKEYQFKFMDLTINESKPNMIIVTGDLFTFADKTTAKKLFDWLDSHNIPWTVTFGNHDEQCYFSLTWLTSLLNNYKSNCYFIDLQDDDVYGNSNFVINLNDGNTIKEQLYIIDSNRYYFKEYVGYDFIKEDQVNWYERMVQYTTSKNGSVVNSLVFFHIPFPEYDEAWNKVEQEEATLNYGVKRENVCCPEYNSGLFNKMVELGSAKGVFVGHDHRNTYGVNYKGILLSYGIKSTDRVYFDSDLLGGQTITIHSDNSITIEQIFHSYSEVA